jgi:hypothetical protein
VRLDLRLGFEIVPKYDISEVVPKVESLYYDPGCGIILVGDLGPE